MLKHLDITRQRLKNFASDGNLRGKVYPQSAPVTLTSYAAPDRITYEQAMQGEYRPLKVGDRSPGSHLGGDTEWRAQPAEPCRRRCAALRP